MALLPATIEKELVQICDAGTRGDLRLQGRGGEGGVTKKGGITLAMLRVRYK